MDSSDLALYSTNYSNAEITAAVVESENLVADLRQFAPQPVINLINRCVLKKMALNYAIKSEVYKYCANNYLLNLPNSFAE